jgi:hypothetical protein
MVLVFRRLMPVVALAAALMPAVARAQTSQRLSVQGSLLYADIYGDNFFAVGGGLGFEAQLRYTPSALSIGAGVQYTRHNDVAAEADGHEGQIELLGLFVEPRYTIYIGSDNVAPYVAARVAIARLHLFNDFSTGEELTWTSPGVTLNGGGGLLVRLSSRLNLDVGASAGFTHYSTAEGEESRDGEVISRFDIDLGSGTNLVFRLGLALGLGG